MLVTNDYYLGLCSKLTVCCDLRARLAQEAVSMGFLRRCESLRTLNLGRASQNQKSDLERT